MMSTVMKMVHNIAPFVLMGVKGIYSGIFNGDSNTTYHVAMNATKVIRLYLIMILWKGFIIMS